MRLQQGRGIAAGVVLATVCGLALPGVAAPRRLCLQVVDAQRDVTRSELRGQPGRLDIVSADVATTREKIVAVVRVRGWSADGLGNADAARTQFWVSFVSGAGRYSLVAQLDQDRNGYYAFATREGANAGYEPDRMERGSGSVDMRQGVVRIEIPRSLLFDPLASQQLSRIAVATQAGADVLEYADEARAARPYTDLTKTCIA